MRTGICVCGYVTVCVRAIAFWVVGYEMLELCTFTVLVLPHPLCFLFCSECHDFVVVAGNIQYCKLMFYRV